MAATMSRSSVSIAPAMAKGSISPIHVMGGKLGSWKRGDVQQQHLSTLIAFNILRPLVFLVATNCGSIPAMGNIFFLPSHAHLFTGAHHPVGRLSVGITSVLNLIPRSQDEIDINSPSLMAGVIAITQ